MLTVLITGCPYALDKKPKILILAVSVTQDYQLPLFGQY